MLLGKFENSSCGDGIYDSTSEQNKILGYFRENELDGVAKFYNTKETYIGEWKKNLYQGYGIQSLACGTVNKGLFKEGKFISEWDFPEDFLN